MAAPDLDQALERLSTYVGVAQRRLHQLGLDHDQLADVLDVIRRAAADTDAAVRRLVQARSVLEPAVEPNGAPATSAEAAKPAGPRRVLAVDDHPELARLLSLLLGAMGHAVVDVTSAEAALALLERETFDMVIADINLGSGMTGWQLAERVRDRWPNVRCLLATGWGTSVDAQEARGRGVAAIIPKPYRLDDLRRYIDFIP